MNGLLSVVMITRNSELLLDRALASVKNIADEIIVVDDNSTDRTVAIAQKYDAQIYPFSHEDFGKRKAYGIDHARCEWILILDSDEIVSKLLADEIATVTRMRRAIDVYHIPFRNHFLGRPLRYGGERYAKPSLFQKKKVVMREALVHEQITFDLGRSTCLHSPIIHYSYRSLGQMYRKFTNYAIREARQKRQAGEQTSMKKIVMYPPHMVWARFIKDRGYKDGLFRLPLDIGFGYMEFLTYVSMLFIR
ncbi:glycosyltransferase family 2 protein [Candidatus Microgenomates bacterium]|nr:glycosyltransferase family 2 protein [Candidatus Microgenomates bacterium]